MIKHKAYDIFYIMIQKGDFFIMVTYHEHIIKRAKKPADYVICALTPVSCLILAYLLTIVFGALIPFLSFLIPAAWVGAGYFAFKIITGRNIEFEYLLTDSDLDIDKIISKSRRKHIISVYRKEIEVIAPNGSSNLPSGWEQYKVIDASSHPDATDAYVLIAQQEAEKIAVIFCPTEKMLETLTMRNPRKVFND